MSQYATFIHALVIHCREHAVVWQLENEVNSKTFWGGTLGDYVQLLTTAYRAAHSADPKCMVLPAGLAQPWPNTNLISVRMQRTSEWLNIILDSHAYDAIDVHDYLLPQSDPMWPVFQMSFEQYLSQMVTWVRAKNA